MAKITLFFTIILLLTIGIYSASKKKCEVLSYQCVGCADCVDMCPKHAITLKRGKAVIDPDRCIGCRQCVYICSFFAVRSYEISEKLTKSRTTKSRKRKRQGRAEKTARQRYSVVNELEKIAELRKNGVITEEEYTKVKQRLLSRIKQ